jgi:hypothetical protein
VTDEDWLRGAGRADKAFVALGALLTVIARGDRQMMASGVDSAQ